MREIQATSWQGKQWIIDEGYMWATVSLSMACIKSQPEPR